MTPLEQLKQKWAARWPEALALWNRFTQLSEPRWCFTKQEETSESLSGSFAMIRLKDHAVVISLSQVKELKLENFPLEIMAHEIGHHIYCPADLTDHARTIARMRAALPTKESFAGYIANLYTDLLINDRLQRSSNLKMAEVYHVLGGGSKNKLWTLYMRIYEILWRLAKGSLAQGEITRSLEGDAQLGARVIRAYAKDWLEGTGRFAALCLPYLMEDAAANEMQKLVDAWFDTRNATDGGIPSGLAEIDEAEQEGALHPSLDGQLAGTKPGDADERDAKECDAEGQTGGGAGVTQRGGRKDQKNYRDPNAFRDLLKSVGVKLDDHEMTMRYYRERALPHLIRFPGRVVPESSEPLPEGLEVWEIGSPWSEIDWFETVVRSPHVVPGVTTVQRTYGTVAGTEPEKQPLDLYLGVDCSGSMANPQLQLSYPVLAGVIICLSALRAGAKVMACLSGEPGRHVATDGFVANENEVLKLLTGYLGSGTTFGIPRLREAFQDRKPRARPAHIMIITDADIYSMLDMADGWKVAREALEKAKGGGTYVLNMGLSFRQTEVARMRQDGWDVHQVQNWEELIVFARAFSQKNYVEPPQRGRVKA